MPLEDKYFALRIRKEIAHFPIDISRMDIASRANVIYLTGVVKRLPREKAVTDLRKSVDQMVEAIRQVGKVRDVITSYLRIAD